jgi:hypothetical protein
MMHARSTHLVQTRHMAMKNVGRYQLWAALLAAVIGQVGQLNLVVPRDGLSEAATEAPGEPGDGDDTLPTNPTLCGLEESPPPSRISECVQFADLGNSRDVLSDAVDSHIARIANEPRICVAWSISTTRLQI